MFLWSYSVEMLALDDESSASGGSQPVVQNYEDLVRNYVVSLER